MRVLLIALLLAACGDDGGGYASFQSCFDSFDASQSRRASIVSCCNETIGGATEVCGTTATSCGGYVSSNLAATSASQTEIIEACGDYEMQRM
ncbi:MAG: hypothetical protein ACKV2T_05095 [Kofleriaceae bacterium]